MMSSALMFSVLINRLPNCHNGLLHKPHKLSHIKSVVPKLGMISVLLMKLLEKKELTDLIKQ